jgi:hypothetical protein
MLEQEINSKIMDGDKGDTRNMERELAKID